LRLRTKLSLLFITLSIIPVIIVGFLAYTNGRHAIEQDIINHVQSTTIFKEVQLKLWILNNTRQIRETASRAGIIEGTIALTALAPDGSGGFTEYYEQISEHLVLTLEEESGFVDFSILQKSDGKIILSTNPSLEGKFRENEDYFIKGLEGTYVDKVIYHISHGGITLHISTPLEDSEGRVLGVLSGHADLDELSDILSQQTGLHESEETYLVNQCN